MDLGLNRSSPKIKRAFDVVFAGIAIVLLAPIWLLIAVAVRLSSPGPVIFRQIRVGRHGESFEMFKFRTMIDGAHAGRAALDLLNESSGIFKLKNDPRLTRGIVVIDCLYAERSLATDMKILLRTLARVVQLRGM